MRICQPHGKQLIKALNKHGLGHLISTTPEELDRKIETGECDPAAASSRNLSQLAIYICGEEVLHGERCPVCELNKIDYIEYAALKIKQALMAEAVARPAANEANPL